MKRRAFLALAAAGSAHLAFGPVRAFAANAKDLAALDAVAQAGLVASRELSAEDLVIAASNRIRQLNTTLNAVVTTSFDRAAKRARTSSAEGQLWGVPYLLKDLNAYKGLRFTRGSQFFTDAVASEQSPYTDKTEAAGLIVLGKTNTPEFGLLPSTESMALGACLNPWNLQYTAGGSSGGAAVAVASRMVPVAQASDGGGSIRIPAACCGLFGLKPSRGRFPDQHTPMRGWDIAIRNCISFSVRDSAVVLALTERGDKKAPLPPTGLISGAGKKRLRIALSYRDSTGRLAEPDVRRAVARIAHTLEENGHQVEEIENLNINYYDGNFIDDFLTLWARGANDIVSMVEQSYPGNLEYTRLLEPWTMGLAKHYRSLPSDRLPQALERFKALTFSTDQFFQLWDAWLTPTTATAPPPLNYMAPGVPYDQLLERVTRFAAFTPLHNVAGTPAMSIPAGRSKKGLPLAAQLSARMGQEGRLLQLAYEIEEARPWNWEHAAVKPKVYA